MPGPRLRAVRRPRTRALTAAVQPITDPRAVFRTTLGTAATAADWQDDAWDMLDQVGELRYYVGWRAASCSRVRLIAADVDPMTGRPAGATENGRAAAIVNQIAGGGQGQSQLVKRMVECLTIPGEVWVAILVTDERVRWLAITKEEMHTTGRTVAVDLPEGERHELDMSRDALFRVWNPRPRRASEPDSPVRACLDSLREIVRTTKTISNASKSRLIGNGVVFVPQEMSLPPVNAPTASGVPVLQLEGTPAVQQLQELLWQVANTAYDDEDSMAALIPMFATVPGDQIKNVQHLKWDNDVTELAVEVRKQAVTRLAMGLDVSPERLLGLGQTTNHWSAWQLADEDVNLHIAPPMETICSALNDAVYRPVLAREGLNPDAYMLWYDAGELTADPDNTDNATAAFQAGAITAEAYLKLLNLPEDAAYDYTTLEGWQQWAQDHVSTKPELLADDRLVALLGPIGEQLLEISSAPPPQAALPPGQEQTQEAEPGTEGEQAQEEAVP